MRKESCLDKTPPRLIDNAGIFLEKMQRQALDGDIYFIDIIFMPPAFADLLSIFTCLWNGEVVVQGISPLRDRVGEQISNIPLTLRDDATIDFAERSRPFDAEGMASQNTFLVRDGKQTGFFFDLLIGMAISG